MKSLDHLSEPGAQIELDANADQENTRRAYGPADAQVCFGCRQAINRLFLVSFSNLPVIGSKSQSLVGRALIVS